MPLWTAMSWLFRRHRASRLAREAAQTLADASGGKPAFEGAAWNSCTADMVRAAKAHAYLALQTNFFDCVHGLQQQVCAA
jgi:Acyl-CoA oxidase